MPPTERVLLVDDDPNILKAYERRLRRRFDIETALCSEEGVTAVNFLGPFAVIVSDMTMPRENGADFLSRMLELCPDSVRIMLTGNADQATAVQAVNQARVYRFLNKPCQADELESAIEEGIEEHRRLRAQRDLMAQTVHGVVSMLTRVLSLVSPVGFGRATRLRALASEVALAAEVDDPWELEIAAALSQLGAVVLTPATLDKLASDQPLDDAEKQQVQRQYSLAAGLIAEAPRLESIARVVALQELPPTTADDPRVRRNAALLRATIALDHLTAERGLARAEAMEALAAASPAFDAVALDALRKVVAKHDARVLIEVEVAQLRDGMHLVEDVVSKEGMVLVTKGHDVTASLLARLTSYASSHGVQTPLRVLATAHDAAELALVAA